MDIKEIKNIIEKYYGLKASQIRKTITGIRNKSFIFNAGKKKYVLRVYAEHKNEKDILFEMRAMKMLANKNFPVPKIHSNKSGKDITKVNNSFLILMDFIEGRSLSKTDVHLLGKLGSLQATLQLALKNLRPRNGLNKLLANWSKWSKEESQKLKPIAKRYGLERDYFNAYFEVKT